LRQPGGDVLPAAAKNNLLRFFAELVAVHRVVILVQQGNQPAEVGFGAGGALLLQQGFIKPGSELGKTL
jgi:hypothetical protein